MFKILIIGPVSFPGSLVSSYYQAFKKIKGSEIVLFDTEKESLFKRVSGNKILDRIKRQFYSRLNNTFLRRKFLYHFKNNDIYKNIDFVLDFKSYWLKPHVLKELKKFTAALIFHINADSPFDKSKSNFHTNLGNCMPFYDCYFTYSKKLIPRLYEIGAKHAEYLPFAFDPDLHPDISLSPDDLKKYGSDITFIGNWAPERENWLEPLVDMDLAIWGSFLWERVKKGSPLLSKWRRKVVVGEEFARVCRGAKIVLNFLRPQNKGSHNMRIFEVPGCGGFLLTERSEEIIEFFEEGKEIACFSTPEELREKLEFYLEHPALRKEMAEQAYRKVQKETYLKRAEYILSVYEAMKSSNTK